MNLADALLKNREKLAYEKLITAALEGIDWQRELMFHDGLGDDLLDSAYALLRSKRDKNSGSIYMVVNPVMPTFYKVGKTKRDMETRLSGLNNEAVPVDYIVVKTWDVFDRHAYEAALHTELSKSFKKHKEFFHGNYQEILDVINDVVSRLNALFEQ